MGALGVCVLLGLLFSCCQGFLCGRGASRGMPVSQSTNYISRAAGFARHSHMTMNERDVQQGDVVVVCGASGGVGRLVTSSLAALSRYKVRAFVRDCSKLDEELLDKVEVFTGDIRDLKSLNEVMKGASAVIAATGTTAFPSGKWRGGNTPEAIDYLGVKNMLQAATDPANHQGTRLKRFIFLSSVGVERRKQLPFSILNAFGVLDAKAKGEQAIADSAREHGFDYVIARPGRLIGEPFTNPDVAGLFKLQPGENLQVQVEAGDSLSGDMARGSVAEAFVQCLTQPSVANRAFTLINTPGPMPTQEDWDNIFSQL